MTVSDYKNIHLSVFIVADVEVNGSKYYELTTYLIYIVPMGKRIFISCHQTTQKRTELVLILQNVSWKKAERSLSASSILVYLRLGCYISWWVLIQQYITLYGLGGFHGFWPIIQQLDMV